MKMPKAVAMYYSSVAVQKQLQVLQAVDIWQQSNGKWGMGNGKCETHKGKAGNESQRENDMLSSHISVELNSLRTNIDNYLGFKVVGISRQR